MAPAAMIGAPDLRPPWGSPRQAMLDVILFEERHVVLVEVAVRRGERVEVEGRVNGLDVDRTAVPNRRVWHSEEFAHLARPGVVHEHVSRDARDVRTPQSATRVCSEQ